MHLQSWLNPLSYGFHMVRLSGNPCTNTVGIPDPMSSKARLEVREGMARE